jgi:hypothetical protein
VECGLSIGGGLDQMVGNYFGLASLYVATHEYNPAIGRSGAALHRRLRASGGDRPVP